jgi:uncharacterized protein YjaG (DUF416 family)
MTTIRFDEKQLSQRIEQLAREDRAAFAAACAQRLQVAYSKFSTKTGRGNPGALRGILVRLWNDLSGKNVMSDVEIDAEIEACTELIPREDDGPWVMEQAAADDAASALAYSLRCRRTGQAQEAAWAARRAYEAVDHYVINTEHINTNSPGAEARILSHPLVHAELARQQRDLDELLRRTVTVGSLRERSGMEAAIFLPIDK